MMRKPLSGTTKSQGFTLTEVAIVLAVVGLILGAIWVAAGSVMGANRADQAVQQIITMASNMRSTFSAANSFTSSGDQTAAMITAGVIPNDLLTGINATPTKNAWNGAVKITFNPTGSNARQFRISYFGTPQDACFRIASQIANLGTSDAPVDMIADSGSTITIATPAAGTTNANCTGVTIGLCSTAINTACAANGNGNGSSPSTEFDFTIH